jgi:hypothetical protein
MTRLKAYLMAGAFCCGAVCFLASCRNSGGTEPVVGIPAEADIVEMTYQDLNSWLENDQFQVAGIAVAGASNPDFQRVWLELEALDAAGKPLRLDGRTSLSVSLFAEALPPQGRSAFFAAWPVRDFDGTPASIRVKSARWITVPAGPVLIASDPESTKMLLKAKDAAGPAEDAWQVAGHILNTSDRPAAAVFEILLYDADNRLWSAHRYNTADGIKSLSQATEGPLAPGEKRRISRLVKGEDLPEGLRASGIARAEVLASEDR